MMWCHGGSGGAFLLRLPTGCISLKGEQCTPGMLFAQGLAVALGVRTAQMRVVTQGQDESAAIARALQTAVPLVEDHKFQIGRVPGGPSAGAVVVMEYVGGCAMMGLPAHEHLKQHQGSSALWCSLGRLIGFDLLLNNFDRLPLAWNNEGNLGNVMLSSTSNMVVGIDQSAQPITNDMGLSNYTARVGRACLEARDGMGESFQAVKQAIFNNTAIELSSEDVNHLRQGCLDFLQEVAQLTSSGDLDNILDDVAKHVTSELAFQETATPLQFCIHLVQQVAHAVEDVLSEPHKSK